MSQHDRFLAFMIMFTLAILATVVLGVTYEDSKLEDRIKALEAKHPTPVLTSLGELDIRGAWESDYIPTPCPCCEEAKP